VSQKAGDLHESRAFAAFGRAAERVEQAISVRPVPRSVANERDVVDLPDLRLRQLVPGLQAFP
jgi:hypothetical protein